MTSNQTRFAIVLMDQLKTLFETPEYATAARKYTPEQAALKYTLNLAAGKMDKDGRAIVATCKALGVSHTYKAIGAYLSGEGNA